MQPFKIQCTTCRRSLRVVNPEAVGQILSCPKCSSMVLVEAPAGWDLSPSAVVEPIIVAAPLAAATTSTIPAATSVGSSLDVIGSATPLVNSPAATVAAPVATNVSPIESASAIERLPKTEPRQIRKPVRKSKPVETVPADDRPATKPTKANSPQKRRSDLEKTAAAVVLSITPPSVVPAAKVESIAEPATTGSSTAAAVIDPWPRWFWPGVASTLVLGVLIVALRLMLHRDNSPAALPTDNAAIAQSPAPPAKVETTQQITPEMSSESVPPLASQPAAQNQSAENPATASAPIATANPSPAIEPPAVAAPQPAIAANEQPTQQPREKTAGSETAPETNRVATAAPAVESLPPPAPVREEKPSGKPTGAVEAPPRVANSGAMHFGPPAVAVPRQGATENPASNDPAFSGKLAEQPARTLRRVPPKTVNVTARLNDAVSAIEVRAMPLVDFLNLVSDLSTIPISIDADAVADMDQSLAAPVAVKLETASVAELLEAALEGLKLGYRLQDGGLIVGYAPQPNLREIKYTVTDLTGTDTKQLGELALLVRRMLSPESWQQVGGRGTMTGAGGALVVNQSDAVHAQMLVFCEKLRIARGLPPKSRFDPSRFALTTRSNKATQLLAVPITANFSAPQSLGAVAKWLHATTGATILIDHAALAQQETSAESECSAVAVNKPLSALLDELLTPIDLAWRIIDARTIEITTRQAAAAHMDLEFYAVRELAPDAEAGQQLIAQIKSKIEPQSWGDKTNQAAVQFDLPSRSLLVRAPQKCQAQIEQFLGSARRN